MLSAFRDWEGGIPWKEAETRKRHSLGFGCFSGSAALMLVLSKLNNKAIRFKTRQRT